MKYNYNYEPIRSLNNIYKVPRQSPIKQPPIWSNHHDLKQAHPNNNIPVSPLPRTTDGLPLHHPTHFKPHQPTHPPLRPNSHLHRQRPAHPGPPRNVHRRRISHHHSSHRQRRTCRAEHQLHARGRRRSGDHTHQRLHRFHRSRRCNL